MPQQMVLVADDEEPMRKLVTTALKVGGYGVVTAADGLEALKAVSEQALDLVLLDLGLPGPDGFEVLQALRREQDLPVLVISGRARERDKVRALDLGADDYLTKPVGWDELMARVRALLRRSGTAPIRALQPYRYRGLEVDFAARQARIDGRPAGLTNREYEVLAYLARNAGKVLLHRQILQGVWGGQYGDESDFVWTYVRRIRRKVEPDPERPRYLLTEHGAGYRVPAPEVDAEADPEPQPDGIRLPDPV
jgi:two-component system KDP operon response regulator KdpE